MSASTLVSGQAWNKGKLVGHKAPLRLNEIYAIRVHLQIAGRTRDLALFNLAIDWKLRACVLVIFRVQGICHGAQVLHRAMVMQRKTQTPVQFEVTEQTRLSVGRWIQERSLAPTDFLFPSRVVRSSCLTSRQYARIVHQWLRQIELDDSRYGTHSMRRTKLAFIYRRTRNLRAVQLLLGHSD